MTEKTLEVTVSPEKGEATVAETKKPAAVEVVFEHARQLAEFAMKLDATPENRQFRAAAITILQIAEAKLINARAQAQAAARRQAAKKPAA